MKTLVQWSTSAPSSWVEYDSSDWAQLPRRPEPTSTTPVPTDEGYVCKLNVQGVSFAGDRLAVVPHMTDAGVEVHQVWDDLEDYPVGWRQARVWTMLPLAPDARFNGAINARQRQTIYAEPAIAARIALYGPGQDVRPWDQYTPLADDVYVRGLWMPDALYQAHAALRTRRGWREWVEGLDPRELIDKTCSDGVVRSCVRQQRPQGRYLVPKGTRTYYHSDTGLTNGIHTADHENELRTGTGTAATQESAMIGGNNDRIIWASTTPAGEPESAAWPTGDYRHQIDCSDVGVDITYGLLTVGGSAGHFARVNAAVTSDLETKVMTETVFSGGGLKLATTGSVSWTAGNVSDRFEIAIAAGRPANHGNQSITVELNEFDDFADGPWEFFHLDKTEHPDTVPGEASVEASGMTPPEFPET